MLSARDQPRHTGLLSPRRCCSPVTSELPRPVAATQRVAAELEAAAERRQLPEGSMARRAWLSGLARIKRKGNGTPGEKGNKKHGRECCRADQDDHEQLVIAEGCSPQKKMRYTRTRYSGCVSRHEIATRQHVDCSGVEGIAIERLTAWRIGAKIRQDPCGLIVPSTTLQAFGGWNWTHLSQRLSPSG